jgi:hypothetical protein
MSNDYELVRTEKMGSCWCDDCYCRIYRDGTIEHTGEMDWQCSERRRPNFVPVPENYRYCKSRAVYINGNLSFENVPHMIDIHESGPPRYYYSNLNSMDYIRALQRLLDE